MDAREQTILVIDFGGPGAQTLARRIREQRVFARILPYTAPIGEMRAVKPIGIVLAGGTALHVKGRAVTCDPGILGLGIPVLAVGAGVKFMIDALGGRTRGNDPGEPEKTAVALSGECLLFRGLPAALETSMPKSDLVAALPEGFEVFGGTGPCPHAAVADVGRGLYGVQFRPEGDADGRQVIRNFLYAVCSAGGLWDMANYIEACVAGVREEVGGDKAVLALSGGVDSSVAAVLLNRAVGSQLTCIFVDHGLLRKNEFASVIDRYRRHFNLNIKGVRAGDRFLAELGGVSDPEMKRKIIGRVFIEIFEEEAGKIPDVKYLAQGTIYPDVIESQSVHGFGGAAVKSHHNVGGLPEKFGLRLVEPLRDLFKDEVRELGLELGIPPESIWRHPFPGPGLAVRILGEVTAERVRRLQDADAIVMEEIERAGWYRKVWQAFPILLPVASTGVKEDSRRYESVMAIRAVHSTDAMTAEWARLPWDVLDRMARRIAGEVEGVGRVVYDITSKPPATIEWE